MPLLSVVVPSFNEEENIENTSKVLSQILDDAKIDYEVVFVNDGSRDATYDKIVEQSQKNPRIKGVCFSRNFGKEASIFAGLKTATGDCVAVMDCDLQHPAELLPKMYEKWKEGYDVVEGIKSDRGKESLFHRLCARTFYKIMSDLINMDMNSTSDYKLLDRKVVDVLLDLPERNTFFRALSFWVGFKTAKIEYEVQERQYGSTKWSFRSLVKYAINNATSFSTMPLQLVTFMGMSLVAVSLVLAVQTLVKFFSGDAAEGFTTVILLILLIGGMIMISLGIVGHYLARVYEEVKGRPRYIIREVTDNVKKQGAT